MIQKKICLLGGFGVGKTSLVSRYVHSIFSDKYLTTVGVKIDKKSVTLDGTDVDLVIWDLYGQDDYQKVRMSYLRGAAGYLLVADGTRRSTLDTALALHDSAQATVPNASFTLVINKADLARQVGDYGQSPRRPGAARVAGAQDERKDRLRGRGRVRHARARDDPAAMGECR